MGDSAASSSRERDEINEASKAPLTTTYLAYDSPCYCLEVAVRSFLKCLGLNSDPSSSSSEQEEEDRNPPPPSTAMDDPSTTRTETEKKATEDIAETASTRRRANIQKPTRPGISTGRPGQTNIASS